MDKINLTSLLSSQFNTCENVHDHFRAFPHVKKKSSSAALIIIMRNRDFFPRAFLWSAHSNRECAFRECFPVICR